MSKVDEFEGKPAFIEPELIPQDADRRIRGERVSISIPVVASLHGKLIQGFIYACNISWSGMALATNFPLSKGDQLKLEFTLPNSHISTTVMARVIHCSDGRIPEEATMVGVMFENLDPNIRRMLETFVLEHL